MDAYTLGPLIVTMILAALTGAAFTFALQMAQGFIFFAMIFVTIFGGRDTPAKDLPLPDTSKTPLRILFGIALCLVAVWLATSGFSHGWTYSCGVLGGFCLGSGVVRSID